MKKLFLFIAALTLSVGLWAETQKVSYDYPVYNTPDDPTSGIKEWKTGEVEATVVTDNSDQVTWNAGWYVVNGADVKLPKGAVCQGDVRLILADMKRLTAQGNSNYAGIQVSGEGNSLTIYGQTKQMGQLIANGGSYGAGIGSGEKQDGSNITINGGIVTANGSGGAGIGGGNGGSGSNITINGGTVSAIAGSDAAGIGGGYKGNGSNITINGGTVSAIAGSDAAGIGGGVDGSGSNITINGGTVTANGQNGAGIGGGRKGSGSVITINGGTVTANSEGTAAGIGGGLQGTGSNITINGGVVTANGGKNAAGIGGGYQGSGSNIKVNTALCVRADSKNPPIAVITNIGADLAEALAGKRYVTVGDDPAYNAGKAAAYVEGYNAGKAEGIEEGKAALPTDAEDAAGHTVTITKGEKTLKLVNPDKVTYGKQE